MSQKNKQKQGKTPPQKSGMQKRVWVTDEVTRKLKEEFKTSGTTVLNALKFASYSEQGKKIRERAMVLMQENEASNKHLMKLFH